MKHIISVQLYHNQYNAHTPAV